MDKILKFPLSDFKKNEENQNLQHFNLDNIENKKAIINNCEIHKNNIETFKFLSFISNSKKIKKIKNNDESNIFKTDLENSKKIYIDNDKSLNLDQCFFTKTHSNIEVVNKDNYEENTLKNKFSMLSEETR